MDALLAEVARHKLKLAPGSDHSPADIAVQIWLLDKDIFGAQHARHFLAKVRSFSRTRWIAPRKRRCSSGHRQATGNNGERPGRLVREKKRGRGAKIILCNRPDGVWFLVRHGRLLSSRKRAWRVDTSCVCYRPLKYDVLVYALRRLGSCVLTRSKGEKQLYCEKFGSTSSAAKTYFAAY